MKKEYEFRRAKRVSYRNLPPIDQIDRHTKVRITIMLDLDVLKFFKERAAKPGAAPYQTQINQALRDYMTGGGPGAEDRLLRDQAFISHLAERVARYRATRLTGGPRRRSPRSR
jgi:uncharacterized protein (DUF4415 family)